MVANLVRVLFVWFLLILRHTVVPSMSGHPLIKKTFYSPFVYYLDQRVPVMTGHLPCKDNCSWSKGCPFMAGSSSVRSCTPPQSQPSLVTWEKIIPPLGHMYTNYQQSVRFLYSVGIYGSVLVNSNKTIMLMKLVFVVILVGSLAARGTNISEVVGRSVARADAVRGGGPERRAVDDLSTPASTSRLNVTAPLGSTGTNNQTASVSTPSTSKTSSPATTTTVTSTQCKDVISTCRDYKQESCVEYKAYMATNCPRFCGFCLGSGPVCSDRLANCARYGKETCLAYANFRDTHCRAYCDNCDANVDLDVQ